MEQYEEFSRNGKNFMYIDFSNCRTEDAFIQFIGMFAPIIEKYPEKSLYTITNIENIKFDSTSKNLVSKYLEHNRKYVKYGVIIGFDGIKKLMIGALFKASGRDYLHFAFSKEQAIEWLLQKD